jgi:hypothetical protein
LRVAFLELRLLNFHGGKSPRSNVVERGLEGNTYSARVCLFVKQKSYNDLLTSSVQY